MSISDESDLTDISDDELEDEPAPLPPPVALAPPLAARRSTRQNSKGKRPQEMGVPNAVISPKTVAYQVKHIYGKSSNISLAHSLFKLKRYRLAKQKQDRFEPGIPARYDPYPSPSSVLWLTHTPRCCLVGIKAIKPH